MNTIKAMHDDAMGCVDIAIIARKRGLEAAAKRLYMKACELETSCAMLSSTEPSKGVLYLSAAWCAFNAGAYEAARDLIKSGMTTAHPEQMKDLMELQSKLMSLVNE